MDRRKEARFQVYAPAKVALLDDPEAEWNGQVIDISGLGLRLVADVEFHMDQIITVETDQHLILADVRNCEQRGGRFAIGAERVHSAAKLALSPSTSKAERNHTLVEDYHRRLLDALPSTTPDAVEPSSTTAIERFEQSHPAPAPAAPATEPIEALPEPVAIAEPVAATEPIEAVAIPEPIETLEAIEAAPITEEIETPEPVEAVAAEAVETHDAIETPEPLESVTAAEAIETPEPVEPLATTEPALRSGLILVEPPAAGVFSTTLTPMKPNEIKPDPQEHLPFAAAPLKVSSNVIPFKTVTEPPAASLETTDTESKLELGEAKATEEAPALEAGDAIREAFLKSEVHEAVQPESKPRSRWLTLLIAAACTLIAFVAIWFGPFGKHAAQPTVASAAQNSIPAVAPASAPIESPVVPKPEVPKPAEPKPAEPKPAVATIPTPTPSAPAPAGQSHAVIEASASSWVTACSDGKVAFTKLLTNGSKENLLFSSNALVRVGNAGSLAISVNGKSVGSLGRKGQLRVVELTPTSSHFILLHDPDGCTQ